jgi:hypothetical protein
MPAQSTTDGHVGGGAAAVIKSRAAEVGGRGEDTYHPGVASGALSLRVVALLAVGGLTVHQLRYLLAFGHDADDALAAQGHAYLAAVAVPVLGLLLAVVLGQLLARVAGRRARTARTPASFRVLWTASAAALMAVFGGQELAEAGLGSGHPGGLAGIVGHGGWMALPLSVAVGGLVAVALRATRAIESATPTVRLHLPPWPRGAQTLVPRDALRLVPHGAGLDDQLAGRGPPLLCR